VSSSLSSAWAWSSLCSRCEAAGSTKPRPSLAIDIPKESGFTQAEEDAVRRSLRSFEECVMREKLSPPPGSTLTIQHGTSVTMKNPTGGGVSFTFLACVEAVDQRIPQVHAGATYQVRL
jgi:hypothetical protein